MSNTVLELRHMSRTYQQGGQALPVLKSIDLEIKKGELVALVGPSGSGKTTLLQIAGLLDSPSGGEVKIAGLDMSKANDETRTLARRKYMGFVYQYHHLLPEFSALENVALPQMMTGTGQQQASQKAKELLAALGLSARLLHRPAKLSGGEQQRVAIARALANDPQLLLADEPTGNLDHHTAEEVFALLLAQVRQRGLAALVATHNMELAKRMDRIITLEDGKVRA